jgi:hypothetical protein
VVWLGKLGHGMARQHDIIITEILMRYDSTPTTPDRHQRNNDLQLALFKKTRPALYERLLAQTPADERAALEARIKAIEMEERHAP